MPGEALLSQGVCQLLVLVGGSRRVVGAECVGGIKLFVEPVAPSGVSRTWSASRNQFGGAAGTPGRAAPVQKVSAV